jgi:O-antigen/teichoic acid export membrane protein
LMSLVFVPFYIKLMGAESYGIIGVYTSLLGVMSILDLGLSKTMTREMSLLSTEEGNSCRIADTARTLELIYWTIALVVLATIMMLSYNIAYHWLNPKQITREYLLQAIWIMALVIGLRWPVAIYIGAFNGLQRQVLLNILLATFATFQGAGALAILWLIEPTIHAFLLWQALIALMQVVVLRIALWRSFPTKEKGKFSKKILGNIWRFAAGMSGIALTGTILTQMDKIILSKILSLREFGYYTFASTIAAALFYIIMPIYTAYYPRLTDLVNKGDLLELVKAYHQGCQLMAVAILPLSLVLVFYSDEVLGLWTRNSEVVKHTSLLFSLMVIGNALNGLLTLPYALQLAYGWTRLALYIHIIDLIILGPVIYFSTIRWNAVGAAMVWIVFNLIHILIGLHFMYRQLLKKEKWKWYVNDVGKILLPALFITSVVRGLIINIHELSDLAKILVILFTLAIATAVAFLSAEALRNQFTFKRFLEAR